MVDLCTGSGAIAKAVADEVPDAEVHAVELDESAHGWAERNLAGTGVDLRQGDMATAFDDLVGTVDVVVCNPPYIPLEAWESVAAEARDHDPHLALFSGDDGLDAMRVLAVRAALLLGPGEWSGPSTPTPRGSRRRRCSPRPAAGSRSSTTAIWQVVHASRRHDWHDRRVQRLPVTTDDERETAIQAAAMAIRQGQLVVMPTDTVYGIAADAFSPDAVQSLLAAKGRGREMPPPVLVSAATTLDALAVGVPSYARALVEEFWPGALTIVCRQQSSLQWDLGETRGTVAVRMPDDEIALAVLERTGPLAVSSANLSGRPAARTADEAEAMLGEVVEVIVDGGTQPGRGRLDDRRLHGRQPGSHPASGRAVARAAQRRARTSRGHPHGRELDPA